nr:MAG TPA: hypothetical protein [Caudoviricetes sp.]
MVVVVEASAFAGAFFILQKNIKKFDKSVDKLSYMIYNILVR